MMKRLKKKFPRIILSVANLISAKQNLQMYLHFLTVAINLIGNHINELLHPSLPNGTNGTNGHENGSIYF